MHTQATPTQYLAGYNPGSALFHLAPGHSLAAIGL